MSKFDSNAVTWFEIPTTDFERATNFYETVLDAKLVPYPGGAPCSIFPHKDGGVSGCIVQSPNHKPSSEGAVVYLNVDGKLDASLKRAENSASTSSSHARRSPAASATTLAFRTRRAITLACTAKCSKPRLRA